MEISLIHAGLAAGAALAALPVILHLFMRQTPKHVVFPAVRLVRERQRRSRKRMRIKNWLLLLARMAILALMALALARPRLYSEVPLGDESVPTALGLVFDTSLSMKYKDKDKTRLDEAKERAREIVSKLPDSSLVFVVDSGVPGIPSGQPPAAALKVIDALTFRAVNRPLNSAMGQVYAAVAECDRPNHVVYVLTDLARSAWHPDQSAEGLEQAGKARPGARTKITTFILRLTPQDPHNVAVESAELSESIATSGEPVEVRTRIRSQGKSTQARLVEFYLDGKKKGEKPVEIPPDGEVELSFSTPPRLDGELHRGLIKLSGQPDPLEDDDLRYITFKVRPPLDVLLVSDQSYDAEFVAAALDPGPSSSNPRSIRVEKVLARNLSRVRETLKNYACVFLLNVGELAEADWGALNQYVHEGGGLVAAPGSHASAAAYNGAIAGQFLPAELGEKTLARTEATFGKIADITHPLFQKEGKDLATWLGQVPIFRYWSVKAGAENSSRTLLSYSDGAPALLERVFRGARTGRVLLWTTPLVRRPAASNEIRRDPEIWNEFPLPAYGWSFFMMMNRTVPYLAGSSNETLDYEAGENVTLRLDPNQRFSSFLLSDQDEKTKEQLTPSASNEYLEVIAPQAVGQWTVRAIAADNRSSLLGFSVNVPRGESKFALLDSKDLDTIFGKGGYLLAEDALSHKRVEGVARYGYEIFPWMMFLILLVVTLENFLANTFYREAKK
jgi:hypothetical protein